MRTITIDFGILSADGFSIDPAGIDLTRFKDNPIITHNFDHMYPIAMAENIKLADGVLTAEIEFDPSYYPKEEVEQYINFMAREGILHGKPGGFIETDGNRITKFTLMEVSI